MTTLEIPEPLSSKAALRSRRATAGWIAAILALVLLPWPVGAQDPAKTDPGTYTVILENDRVRVLKYRDLPGQKTARHHHPDFVLYALAPFERRLTFADGTKKERAFKKGDVIFMKDQVHIGENVGTTATDVVIVELKAPPAPAKR